MGIMKSSGFDAKVFVILRACSKPFPCGKISKKSRGEKINAIGL